MCKFFSLISSGDGKVYYFTPEQRVAGVKDKNGKPYEYDSHTSIAQHFLGAGKEDRCNKWEYDLFADRLRLDEQHTADDREAVLAEISKIDFAPIAGDVQGVRNFLAEIKAVKWFDNHGVVPEGVKMFDTWAAARDAACDAAGAAACDAAWAAARYAARDAACDAAGYAAWAAARDAAWAAAGYAARDAARAAAWAAAGDARLYTLITHICAGLPIDAKHVNYIKTRWGLWVAGYGVAGDVNGVFYCYKKP